jgi:cytidylate kinase
MVSVAIDGPAGAGKSTIAKKVAASLGYTYVDTGALYRAVGLSVLRAGIDINNTEKFSELLKTISIDLKYINSTQHVFLNGEDVSEKIRTPQASMMASNVAVIPLVREFLFSLQQSMAEKYNVVMDGRDIGTVVLPNADVKIFLTASAEVRAKRRYDELIEKGQKVEYQEVLKDLKERDYQDANRKVAPLKQAEDAHLADTSDLSLDDSIELILNIVKNNLGKEA